MRSRESCKSIRVHERHDNRQGRSPFGRVSAGSDDNIRIRDLWVMELTGRLQFA
jgi:hypothetical protein